MHLLSSEQKPPAAAHRLPLHELRGVRFRYPDGKEALKGVSLTIRQGDRVALVGRNGSGKTTLVKQLNGLLKPTAGMVLYKGEPLEGGNLREIRLRVGVMFQDPDDQLFCNTLYEDVAFGPMNQGLPRDLVDQRVREAIANAGLSHLMYKPAHLMSVGQKKRAAFAAVMAMRPEMLILDEPSANLDPRQERLFKQMLEGYDGTLVCINHDLLFLYGLCDRAVVLADGAVHHDFSFDDLISHPDSLREHGLDFTFRFACCGQAHPHGGGSAGSKNALPCAAAAARNPLILLEQYSFRYPDGTKALDGVDLAIDPLDTVALIGENGAGKSTLASILLGLNIGSGRYLYDGEQMDNQARRHLWRRMGIVFQDSSDQLFCPTCREEVAFGPRQLGLRGADLDARVAEALELVDLSGYGERVPLNLSGGERKRLAIAAALAMRPEVLILDEPTAGLDPRSEERLLDILEQLEVTMILISHDLFFVQRLCRRAVVMHRGRVIRDYLTEDFLCDDHLESMNELDFTYKNICTDEIKALQGG